MEADPILQEIWDIKDRLAAESGYDINRFVQQLREWSAAHPHNGPVVHNAQELRQLIAEQERQRAEQSALALNEEPPKPETP